MAEGALVVTARRAAIARALRLLLPLSWVAIGVAAVLQSVAGTAAAVLVTLALWLAKRFTPGMIVVGAEGIDLRGPGLRRFIPFARVVSVACAETGVLFVLDDGQRIALQLFERSAATYPGSEAQKDQLFRGISAAVRAWNEREGTAAGAGLLGRDGRTLEAWRSALFELRPEADGGYRRARLSLEELTEVVEDPAAEAERRIGAALVLARVSDETIQTRVRVAIDGCASEPLRVALRRAARDALDETTLDRAVGGPRRG